eukprot:3074855-Pyramimonas_sp.AAC.1
MPTDLPAASELPDAQFELVLPLPFGGTLTLEQRMHIKRLTGCVAQTRGRDCRGRFFTLRGPVPNREEAYEMARNFIIENGDTGGRRSSASAPSRFSAAPPTSQGPGRSHHSAATSSNSSCSWPSPWCDLDGHQVALRYFGVPGYTGWDFGVFTLGELPAHGYAMAQETWANAK